MKNYFRGISMEEGLGNCTRYVRLGKLITPYKKR
jgi:hypothetical protein